MARERSKNRETETALEPRRMFPLSRWDPWPRFAPFGMMRRMFDDMDRMFERMFEDVMPGEERGFPRLMGETFTPTIDVFERDGKLVVRADVPGLSKDDLKVDVSEDNIVIEGERKYEHEAREEGVYRAERGYGHFRRMIPLPEGVKPDTATAKFKNGVLEVTMEAPQLSKARRRVEIKEGEPGGQKAA